MIDKKGKVIVWTAIAVVLVGLVMTTAAYPFPTKLPGNFCLVNTSLEFGSVPYGGDYMVSRSYVKPDYVATERERQISLDGSKIRVILVLGVNASEIYYRKKECYGFFTEEIDGIELTHLISFRSTRGIIWVHNNETLAMLCIPMGRREYREYIDIPEIISEMQRF